MTLTKIIIAILIILLMAVIITANRIRVKRRENEPIELYDTEDYINPKGTNLDSRSTYDDRLLKKYESLAIWIKLRERYGKRLISYTPANPKDADKVNKSKKPLGLPIYVKYVSEDGRVLDDEMYVKFISFHEMALVTLEEHKKLKANENTEFTVTQAEINAMKERMGSLSSMSDEKIKEFIFSEKRLAK